MVIKWRDIVRRWGHNESCHQENRIIEDRKKAEDYTGNLGNQLLVLNNQRKGTIYVSLKLSSSRSQIMGRQLAPLFLRTSL